MELDRQHMCELTLQNLVRTRNVMRSQDSDFASLCAVIAATWMKKLKDDEIEEIQQKIRKSRFLGSEFLPGSRVALATIMRMDDPDATIERVIKLDQLLLDQMLPSHHLSLTAMLIAGTMDEEHDPEHAAAVGEIYQHLRGLFPFLVSDNDCCAAAYAYIAGLSAEDYGNRMDRSLAQLRRHALSRKVLIPLAQIFALSDEHIDSKVAKFRSVLDMLEDNNIPVGTEDYDFAALGALALLSGDLETSVKNIKDILNFFNENQPTHRLQKKVRNKRRTLYAIYIEGASIVRREKDRPLQIRKSLYLRCAMTAALVNDVTSFLDGIN